MAQSAACAALNADFSNGATITLAPPSGNNEYRDAEYGPPFAGTPFDVGETVVWSAQSSGPGDTTGSGDLTVYFTVGTMNRTPVYYDNTAGNFDDAGSFQIVASDGGYVYINAAAENRHPVSGLPQNPISSLTFSFACIAASPVPTITTISPTTGPTGGGTSVTITGTNFTGATAVTFGGTAAASYTVDSATQITAVTPAHATGAVDVAVTTSGGTATAADGFTYAAPTLSINDVSIAEGNAGTTSLTFTASLSSPAGPGGATFDIASADNTATVTGGDYATNSLTGQIISAGSSTYDFTVAVNGDTSVEPNETFFVNITNISGATAGDVQGTGTITNDDAAAPSITGVSPSTGTTAGGTSVTITGTNLTSATAISFGGSAAASFTVDSATQITAVTPAHAAGAVDVVVTAPGGAATAAGAFTYQAPIPAPTVTGVTPNTGTTAGGTSVTITGTNLTGATAVTFGGTTATSFTVDSATQITAVTPAHATGAVDVAVTTPGGSATAANAFTYQTPTPAPTITSLAPTTGTTAGGTSVTIVGTDLTGATMVSFGGTAAASFTVDSATQITAVTPAHATGAVDVVVITLGGTATAAGGFAFAAPARPDPSLDPEVIGLLTAQADSARRVAGGQIRNFGNRLEQLHDEDAWRSSSMNIRLGFAPAAGPRQRDIDALVEGSHAAVSDDLLGYGPQRSGGSDALSAAESLSVPAAEPGIDFGDYAIWSSGFVNFGQREDGGLDLDHTQIGVSAGIDYRFTDQFIGGFGIGYSRDRSDIGGNGSESHANAVSAAIYGSYEPVENFFLDGLIGASWLDFNSLRHVAATGDFASGSRDGRQIFGLLTAAYEFRDEAWLVSPYGRLEFSRSWLDGFTEDGGGAFALRYGDQIIDALSGVIGLRADYTFVLEWGTLTPGVRIEYTHDIAGSSRAELGYADLGGLPYALDIEPTGQSRTTLGLSLGAELPQDWSLMVDYSTAFGSGVQDHSFGVELSKRF